MFSSLFDLFGLPWLLDLGDWLHRQRRECFHRNRGGCSP